MTQLAQIRNVLLCTLATLTLAACGGGADSGSASATAATSDTAAAQSNAGMIDRSQGINDTQNTSSSATVASTATPTTTPKPPVTVVTTNGVATLDWMPPTQNSDGSALTNLAGYTVYYGTSPNDLSQSVKVSNPGLTAYSVTGLNSGTWYFAITSYSADGVESSRTSTVSTTI